MEEKTTEEKPEEQFTEPESAFPEALLEFQIETKEATIDQVLSDLQQVEKKNKKYHERNDLLKKEQQAHIWRVLRQIEKEKKEQDEKKFVAREDVEESLIAKWQYVKDKEQLLKDLCFQIEETEQRLSAKQNERDYWLEYKNVGRKEQANKILNLEKEIEEVKDDLNRSTGYYRNALKAVKEENDRLVEMHMKLSKDQAPENAVRYLDKKIHREIEENEWLKEEIELYRKEIRNLKASIQLLEEENINLVTKLVDGKLKNPREPRHSFLTWAAGLQDDFPEDEMKEVECRQYEAKADGEESLRSATVLCQENKIFFEKIQSETENEKLQYSDEELQEESSTLTLGSLLYEDEKNFQEYLNQDALEPKLLCVVGRAMPIHKELGEMPSRSHAEDGVIVESERHITAQMIKALSKEEVG